MRIPRKRGKSKVATCWRIPMRWLLYWTVYLLLALFVPTTRCIGALYADNGLDQTLAYNFQHGGEQEDMQQDILNILGLDKRPKPKRNATLAAKYLSTLYRSLLDEESGNLKITNLEQPVIVEGETISRPSLLALNNSDVIMSFTNQLPAEETTLNGRRFWTEVSQVSLDHQVMESEFRLYRTCFDKNSCRSKSFQLVLSLVQMTDPDSRKLNIKQIATKHISSQSGWLMFNITEYFELWTVFPERNNGLYLQVFNENGEEVELMDAGIQGTNNQEKLSDKDPFILSYLKLQVPFFTRSRRSVENGQSHNEEAWNPYLNPGDRLVTLRQCQINTLYVSFRDLGWQDWIIAPDGYAAYYCHGECSFPLKTSMNATNHAIVQTLVHLMHPYTVPKPCCAPTKLSAIMVLYFDDNSNVILKKYKNMVVKACGCH